MIEGAGHMLMSERPDEVLAALRDADQARKYSRGAALYGVTGYAPMHPSRKKTFRERFVNVNELVAIDVHTHAEEPCGTHPDDGYDELQAQMAIYFNQPNNRSPRSRKLEPIIANAKSAR